MKYSEILKNVNKTIKSTKPNCTAKEAKEFLERAFAKYASENFVTSTTVGGDSKYKYGNWLNDELMDYVRNAKTDKDALWNINLIMKEYEKRKTFKEKLIALFK